MKVRMTRRTLLAAAALTPFARTVYSQSQFASHRPPLSDRKFTSPAVERQLAEVKARIKDPELAWLFEN